LENQNSDQALWYFSDDGEFICHSSEHSGDFLEDFTNLANIFFKSFFKNIFALSPDMLDVTSEFNNIFKKEMLNVQFKALKIHEDCIPNNGTNEIIRAVQNVLRNFSTIDFQDQCISEKKVSIKLSQNQILETDKTIVVSDFFIVFPFKLFNNEVIFIFMEQHMSIPDDTQNRNCLSTHFIS